MNDQSGWRPPTWGAPQQPQGEQPQPPQQGGRGQPGGGPGQQGWGGNQAPQQPQQQWGPPQQQGPQGPPQQGHKPGPPQQQGPQQGWGGPQQPPPQQGPPQQQQWGQGAPQQFAGQGQHGPHTPSGGWNSPNSGPFTVNIGDQQPPRKRRVPMAAIVGIGALLVAGGGGAAAMAAYSWYTGASGTDPAAAVPANAVAFASVDLDPSGKQKVDAVRFMMKFPKAKEEVGDLDANGDIKKALFEAMQKDGQFSGLNYDTDVKPWLGDRLGFAAVPGSDGKPKPVLVLPVTDQDKAKSGLGKMTAAEGGACEVGDEFALCGEDQATMSSFASSAKGSNLADAANYKNDMGKVESDGFMWGWANAGELSKLAGSYTMGSGIPTVGQTNGRVAMTVRFDGGHLEMDGHVTHPDTPWAGSGGSSSVGDLPADTVMAVGVSGLGDQIKAQWPQFVKVLGTGGTDGQKAIDDAEEQLGISLPDDLANALGSDTVVAVGGQGSGDMPLVAVRTNGSKDVVQRLINQQGGSNEVKIRDAGGKTVYATDDGYAGTVATGKGLGDSDAFKNAVPEGGDSRIAMYMNVPKLAALSGDTLDADTKSFVDAISSVGVSVKGEGAESDFLVRIATNG